MSRWDLTGLFWDDYVAPKVKAEKIVRTPPEPFWLDDDYLPHLEEARAYRPNVMTDAELLEAAQAKDHMVWDTEFYPNFALIGARSVRTGKLFAFELNDGQALTGEPRAKLAWIARSFTFVGFNDNAFDVPMLNAVLAGFDTYTLADCADDLINGGELGSGIKPFLFYRLRKIKPVVIDNIDLIELTPLGPGLKICAGRLHARRMADLPFRPGRELSEDQKTIMRWYWVNDLENTTALREKHSTALELRGLLTAEYGVDVRSKSDPQIAEAVIRKEVQRITGRKHFERAEIEPGRKFRYRPASYLRFQTPEMRWVLDFIQQQDFTIDSRGTPVDSELLQKLVIPLGRSQYKMGSGGLHSREKRAVHVANEDWEITDNDVTSYYPSLIIQQGMYPPNVGPAFLDVFKRIYHRRISAKREGDKATAETLKIVLNGTFGKTGERGGFSIVYYPEMMIQVTLTGQLALLMLIEALEISGIQVISANTDGIMVKCPRPLIDTKQQIMDWWQRETGLELESKGYKAVYSRDVNNYIALYEKPDTKETGAWQLGKAIGTYRKTVDVYPLKWNPTCDICSEALILYLANGTPLRETIDACDDIRKFIEARRVTGGAVKDGEYLGKAIRWYYAKGETSEIINAKNGHVVPNSLGGRPCMTLPQGIPDDLDRDYYETRALKMLEKLLADDSSKENDEMAA